MKERDVMKDWAAAHLKKNPEDYWLRLEDGMYGNFKPADGILFSGRSKCSVMCEFKVERRKTFAYVIEETRDHQRRELKLFEDRLLSKNRISAVVVYHLATKEWHVLGTGMDTAFVLGVDARNFHKITDWI